MSGDSIIVSISSEGVEPVASVTGLPTRKGEENRLRKLRRDRRKNRRDRRKEVRDGVLVTLSSTNDRRKSRERRKVR
jgi:hypothetical protein